MISQEEEDDLERPKLSFEEYENVQYPREDRDMEQKAECQTIRSRTRILGGGPT